MISESNDTRMLITHNSSRIDYATYTAKTALLPVQSTEKVLTYRYIHVIEYQVSNMMLDSFNDTDMDKIQLCDTCK